MAESTFQLLEPLTEREYDVLQAMAEGLSNQEIANSLHVALATVKWYNAQIYTKLSVNNRNDAVKQARIFGLLERETHTLPDVPHNLPQQTTPFIGRYEELSELDTLLNNPSIRLITILAPGGMGKTRLALQAAEQQLVNFADGVFFVGLAPLLTHTMIHAAIAEIFQLFNYGDTLDLKQGVLTYLQSKQLLLLFDNFEHLLEGAGLLKDILQVAPKVKILVTSRERLNLQGETVFTLGGMSFPSADGEYIPEYDSIRLFFNGTRRVRPDYELNEFDIEHVVQICRLVDGMPLGIELASGWMDVMSAEKIAKEIRSCIDILETDMRDMPERHRSIRATFNRSWDSLSEQEQETMLRLSIFRGGFRQEAAEHIADANIRILKRLVNKALLYVDPFGRYGIHELLRQYCQEKLEQAGEFEQALEKHAFYYNEYLAQRSLKLDAFEGLIYQEVGAELDNILMAWNYLIHHERFDLLQKAARAFWAYMSTQSRTYEAIDMLRRAIDTIEPQMTSYPDGVQIYGELMIHYIQLNIGLIDYDESHQQALELVELLEPFGETKVLADSYIKLIEATNWAEDTIADVETYIKKAQRIYTATGSVLKQASTMYILTAFYYFTGDHEKAWKLLEQALSFTKEHNLSDQLRVSKQQTVVEMYIHAGKYDEAEEYLDEALLILERAEWVYGLSDIYRMKLNIAMARNKIEDAKQYCAAIIRWHGSHAKDWQMLGALWGAYARWFLMPIGEDERATEIFSFVVNHPISIPSSVYGANFCLDQLKERMDTDVFAAAFERGKELELKQVVADAMAFLTI